MLKARFYGLIGAGAFALAAGGLIAVLALSSEAPSTTQPDADTPAPPDIRDALPQHASVGAMAGKDLRVQMMDKEDPTRQSGELRAAVVDPMQLPGHYAVDKPQIWMFLKSGKTLYVRADSGQLVMPSRRQEPESGVLRGAVEIRLYDTLGVGDELELGPPSIVAKTAMLTFDTTVPEMESPQPFTVEGRGIFFEGQTLRVLASQTRERLELVEVLRGGTLVYTPPKQKSRQASRTARPADAGAMTPRPSRSHPGSTIVLTSYQPDRGTTSDDSPIAGATEDPIPNIVNYLTSFSDNVVVTQTSRVLTGDRLDVWSRIVDGKLPDGAIGGSDPRDQTDQSDAPPPAPDPTPQESEPKRAPVEPLAAPAAVSDESVRLTWTGPMVARPLANEPRELELDDVWLRVTADQSGIVTMDDKATGAEGRCALLDYAATRQELGIARSGAQGATLTLPERGRITATRIEQNLATGVGHVPGAGTIESLEGDDPRDENRPLAHWSQSATFLFHASDGRMTDQLREAILDGKVHASSSGSSIGGDTLHAFFAPGLNQSPSLSRARSTGDVLARDSKGNSIRADELDVAFKSASPGEDPDPSVATAVGSVKVTSEKGEIVTAALVEAHLERDARGNLTAHTARAEEWVEVTTPDGRRAITPLLMADVANQVVDLIGPGSLISQTSESTVTVATGDRIQLDGRSSAIEITGAGTFSHGPAQPTMVSTERAIEARWTESMRFDDANGVLIARGDVNAISNVSAFERQTLEADWIDAKLEPAETYNARVRDAKQNGLPSPDREILFAQAVSDAAAERESRIQAVYYAKEPSTLPLSGPEANHAPRIERLFQAQGATITSDNAGGFIEIPGPGRMVVADLRPREHDAAPSASPVGGSSRGRSLFDWQGSMRYERGPGIIRLSDRASLVQRRLEDGGVLNVTGDVLEARVRETPASSDAPETRFDLTGVTARGNVVVTERVGSPLVLKREILAAVLDYDTVRATAEATAGDGESVTLFETDRGTPVRARSIFWDLARDRIDIRGLGTVSGPR